MAVGFFNERRDEADHVAVELAKALKSGGEAVQTETCPLVGPWLRCGKELERVMGIYPQTHIPLKIKHLQKLGSHLYADL